MRRVNLVLVIFICVDPIPDLTFRWDVLGLFGLEFWTYLAKRELTLLRRHNRSMLSTLNPISLLRSVQRRLRDRNGMVELTSNINHVDRYLIKCNILSFYNL